MKLRDRKSKPDYFKRSKEEIKLGLSVDQAKARRER